MSSILYSSPYKLAFMEGTLSHRIAQLLEKTTASQAELARVVKVSPTTVMYWLNGATVELKPKHAFRIADHFKCSARWLMIGEGAAWPNGRHGPAATVAEERAPYGVRRSSRAIERLQVMVDRGELVEKDIEVLELVVNTFKHRAGG